MTFRAVSERTVHTGYVLDVCVGTFAAPDGTTFERDVVHHPGAVAIIAVEDDHLWMVRQYRPALDAFFLEIPAGLRDVSDEPTVDTARRELREEVGLEAGSMELVMSFHNSIGFCDELIDLFVATDLREVERATTDSPEEVEMEILRVPVDTARSWISDGTITDAKTIIAVLQLGDA